MSGTCESFDETGLTLHGIDDMSRFGHPVPADVARSGQRPTTGTFPVAECNIRFHGDSHGVRPSHGEARGDMLEPTAGMRRRARA